MQQIRVLPDHLVNQIAAGEVIERPASVVKELVENALDAGATRVAVAIGEGGMRSIRVTDNGVGMDGADATLAFQRHATSKIRSAEDLAQVDTLGFRGEALPSIASVARVRLRSRRADDALGIELCIDAGQLQPPTEVACAAGTRVEVDELFGRVPARRKFLKTATTESTHIVRLLERIALARPDVHFELERDGRGAVLFPATASLRERAIAVLPPSAGERLVPVDGEIPGASVRGFASPTDVMRGNTDGIHLFVNARPVRDRLLMFAVREAYRDALPPGRHPIVALFVALDPEQVDVNVHPTKAEVRFRDPRAISQLVRRALQAAIGRRPAPEPMFAPEPAPLPAQQPAFPGDARPMATHVAEPIAPAWTAPEAEAPLRFAALRYVGQLMGGYLVLEAPGRMVLIDQHAAHERVLFERLRQSALVGKVERQALLVPVRVELSRSAGETLLEQRERVEAAGFELAEGPPGVRGTVRIEIRAVPAVLAERRSIDWAELLDETAASLRDPASREARDGLEGLLHHIAATAACHAATRKGDRLEPREVQALLEALDDTLWVPNCPHGRPVMATLDESEIERRFLRR